MFWTFDEGTKRYENIVWSRPNGSDMSTALYRWFGSRHPFQLGVQGLCGCTVLIVVGRVGVYAAHYWENPCICATPSWYGPGEQFGSKDEWFERSVVRGLREGIPGEQVPLEGGPFNGGPVTAILMRPNKPCPKSSPETEMEYHARWKRIKEVVASIVPALADEGNWKEVKYDKPFDDDKQPNFTAKGRLVFRYDVWKGLTGTHRETKVWAELHAPHHDTWHLSWLSL